MSTTRGLRRLALVFALAAGVSMPVRAQHPLAETRLKAAIIVKLVPFVDWPPAALGGRASVDLCVADTGPFAADLQELEGGETLKNLPVAVRRVARERDLDGCQVLVLPADAGTRASRRLLLRRASALPILTVGDDDSFLEDGGIIRLRIVSGHPRFDINDAVAQKVGLRISSRLLGLAETVVRGTS